MPCEHRVSKSPRAVTNETANRSTSSRTVTCPFCSISSSILRRRCSAKRRESLLVIIKLEPLGGVVLSSASAFSFIHPFKENKRKRQKIGDFSSWLSRKQPQRRVRASSRVLCRVLCYPRLNIGR